MLAACTKFNFPLTEEERLCNQQTFVFSDCNCNCCSVPQVTCGSHCTTYSVYTTYLPTACAIRIARIRLSPCILNQTWTTTAEGVILKVFLVFCPSDSESEILNRTKNEPCISWRHSHAVLVTLLCHAIQTIREGDRHSYAKKKSIQTCWTRLDNMMTEVLA